MAGQKRSPLQTEAGAYKALRGKRGIPAIYWIGREGEYNVMAMELLGPSLDDLLRVCPGNKFSPATVLRLGEQMVFVSGSIPRFT